MEEPRHLGGRYELSTLLGRGGMAEVHMGRDVRLGRTVAVKTLRIDLARDPTFQARFRREAQSAASLNHPSVVAVYDTGEDLIDGVAVPYIVMEYVDGSTLRDLLQSGRRLLPERALEITAGVLAALDYSHRNGIIHRDIKPGNVMLTRMGQVKVMDFGIARAVADSAATMTQTAAVIGTAHYLSPEQARGEPVDARSDLYSAGCLLYELLTGRPPFIGDSPVSVAYQHVREDPVAPSLLDPEVPPDADRIVLKALAKNPDNRYQSAEEMRADIERAVDGYPVSAPPVMAMAPTQQYGPTGAQTAVMSPMGSHRAVPEDEPRNRKGAYALLALAALVVFAAAALLGRQLFSDAEPTAFVVPTVTDMSLEQAEQTLEDQGLRWTIQSEERDDVEPNTVLAQDPAPPAEVQEGDNVELTVAVEPGTITVPDVVGDTEDEATTTLEEAGFTVDTETEEVDDEDQAGRVIRQDPEQGAERERDSTVTITIGEGPELIRVPNVINETEDIAKARLEELGFNVKVEYREQPSATPGTVVNQVPEPESERREGATVTIFVAEEPEETETPTEEPTDPPGDGDGNGGGFPDLPGDDGG